MDILESLLSLSPKLRASYELYHHVRRSVKQKDMQQLQAVLSEYKQQVSSHMQISIRTFEKYSDYIENTLKYPYTNGILEGLNNKIKVIKRIAFGYRCFHHFKNRIMITQNIADLKTN